ncbi:MAG: hypothetical protein DIU78_014410 [Pseudomonadota bacterium]
METVSYTYERVLADAAKVHWDVDDLIGGERRLDFSRPFLPDSLARVQKLDFLTPFEKTTLNQIRSHGYLYMFGLVEEFILPFVLDHARPHLHGGSARVRALLRFASEEAKHIELFRRFRAEFTAGFGTECPVIGPPEAIARTVLSHHPLAIGLLTLHIEWMTQRHYVDSVRDDAVLDAQFKSLLKHHWLEECQHAKLDTLIVESIAATCTPAEIDQAIDEYLQIGAFFDQGLAQQVDFDLRALEEATKVGLSAEKRNVVREVQHGAQRWTFLGSGMTHEKVLATVGRIRPAARERIAEIGARFC